MTPAAYRELVAGLDQREEQALLGLLDRLGDISQALRPGEYPSTNDLADAVLSAPGAVQMKVQTLFEMLSPENARQRPFESKMTIADFCKTFDFDADSAEKVMAGLNKVLVEDGLIERMTPPEEAPVARTSLRDELTAAVDASKPRRQLRAAVNDYTTDAAEGLSLRDTIGTLVNTTEQLDGVRYDPRDKARGRP